jgi:DNA-binding response OmpR family regulator
MPSDSAPETVAPMFLYVEDEIITQDLVEVSLREAGFHVLTASDGAEAIRLLAKADGELRGLITDIDLGDGPDGWAVARQARELIGGLPVVYVSGASDADWTSRGLPNSVMIAKPFAPAQVVVAISALLVQTDTAPQASGRK